MKNQRFKVENIHQLLTKMKKNYQTHMVNLRNQRFKEVNMNQLHIKMKEGYQLHTERSNLILMHQYKEGKWNYQK